MEAIPLAQGFSAQTSHIDVAEWDRHLPEFQGANFFQTFDGASEMGGRRTIHPLIVRRDGRVAGMAIAREMRIPLISAGFASVYFGPLWRRMGEPIDRENLRQAARALRNEFVGRKGLMLRISPRAFREDHDDHTPVLAEEGFTFIGKSKRRLLINLEPSLDDLRAGMTAHARRNLRTAERNNLEIFEGDGSKDFDIFRALYAETASRKQLNTVREIDQFRNATERLPEELKPKLLLCRSNGEICAGNLYSSMGTTCAFFASAANKAGMELRAPYLLHWRSMVEAKQCGAQWYDLDGIDPKNDPGPYRFKSGLAGVNGRDTHTLGWFEASPETMTYRAAKLVRKVARR